MNVYEAASLEDLARKTGLSLRTLQRWNTEKRKPQIESHLQLLELAGLLHDVDDPIPPLVYDDLVISTARRLAEEAEDLVRLLGHDPPADAAGAESR